MFFYLEIIKILYDFKLIVIFFEYSFLLNFKVLLGGFFFKEVE